MSKRKIAASHCPGRILYGDADPLAGRELKQKPLMRATTDTLRRRRYGCGTARQASFIQIDQARSFRQLAPPRPRQG